MKYLRPLFNVFIFYAIIHLVIALILSVKNLDLSYLNLFSIISVSDIFPGIEKGLVSEIISIILIACAYFYFFKRQKAK